MALTTTEEALVRQLIAQNAELLNLATNEATIISKLSATKKNLGQLTAASSVANTDLAFVRQGTSDKSVTLDILKDYAKPGQATEVNTGVVELATAAEVQAGTDTVRAVTPAGLAANTATETRTGIAEIATQAETNAGTDDLRFITPLKNRFGFAISLATTGYIKFPAWLGGLIIEWGRGSAATTESTETLNFPLAFPTACLHVAVTTLAVDSSTNDGRCELISNTTTQAVVRNQFTTSVTGTVTPMYIAIGY